MDFLCASAEGPVMFNSVFVGSFAHVMNSSVAYGESSFGDELEQVDPQANFLLVVTWPKGEGDLVIPGVHHVFVPLCEAVGNGLQNALHLCGDC